MHSIFFEDQFDNLRAPICVRSKKFFLKEHHAIAKEFF